ncbi:hypothetical protein BFP72_00380 [Reichenbachiella sp. 5M10]|uniref:hypothetical protein n=1 Tax=Reichenbachiella sp. 5M10 TaxID=1889772 RepID=UPI000C16270B|nr:hypothetical protein [Reichenbachiella sp. 5M10]PIB33995.1 hypothetical protein BFP72_00380 [Reichenbachiella sp. 5M10]
MYEIAADVDRNILLLRLEGFLTDDEIAAGVTLVMSEVKKLKSGFVVINDISKLKPASPQGTEDIKKAQKYVIDLGASKIIRVTENPISKMQFNRTGVAAGYEAMEVETLEAAYALIG